jgi:hypothetical protein
LTASNNSHAVKTTRSVLKNLARAIDRRVGRTKGSTEIKKKGEDGDSEKIGVKKGEINRKSSKDRPTEHGEESGTHR